VRWSSEREGRWQDTSRGRAGWDGDAYESEELVLLLMAWQKRARCVSFGVLLLRVVKRAAVCMADSWKEERSKRRRLEVRDVGLERSSWR
jgi:hypothetical protein